MAKLKTRKTAAKRFKVTKSGKILRRQAMTSHLRSKESAKTKRRKDRLTKVSKSNKKRVERMIAL